jgi:IMP dehydrogenase
MVTGRDYRPGKTPLTKPVTELMTPFDALTCGKIGLDLEAANDLIWSHKLSTTCRQSTRCVA